MLWVRVEQNFSSGAEAESTAEKIGADTVKARTGGLEGEKSQTHSL
jgi:hypothetical protein